MISTPFVEKISWNFGYDNGTEWKQGWPDCVANLYVDGIVESEGRGGVSPFNLSIFFSACGQIRRQDTYPERSSMSPLHIVSFPRQ